MPSYHVAKSVWIDASPDQVFEVVRDYNTWTTWSPWLLADPEAKVTVSADPSSVGSTYAWEGPVTGQGLLTHLQMTPSSAIDDDLQFIKPFKAMAKTGFQFKPARQGTELTWSMDGNMPWFLFWMVPMMKTFIGMDYLRGLMMIKDWVEKGSIPSRSIVHGVEQVGPIRMAGIVGSGPIETIGDSMDQTFKLAKAEFDRLKIPMDAPMISVYTKFRVGQGIFDYISGFIIPQSYQVDSGSKLKVWSIPRRDAFRVEHIGSYRHLGNGWSVANQIARHRKLKQHKCGTFELHRNTPEDTPESELRTDIFLPLK